MMQALSEMKLENCNMFWILWLGVFFGGGADVASVVIVVDDDGDESSGNGGGVAKQQNFKLTEHHRYLPLACESVQQHQHAGTQKDTNTTVKVPNNHS